MAAEAVLPAPTREQVLAAVGLLEARWRRPVLVGEVAAHVAGALGIGVPGTSAYEYRRSMSWQGLQTHLRNLVRERVLVRHTESNWEQLTRVGLFGRRASGTTWAYMTAQRAGDRVPDGDSARYLVARAWATGVLAERHPQEFQDLMDQWLTEDRQVAP
jgi:hypothetical protein